MAGIDEGPLTLRELLIRADAAAQHAWNQTALLASLIHNQHAARKDRKPPSYFHPYHARPSGQRVTTDTIDQLKDFLPRGHA